MDDMKDLSGNDKEIAEEALGSLGVPEDSADDIPEGHEPIGHERKDADPLYVQKRLKQKQRVHDREMREMQARIAELQSQIPSQNPQSFEANPYAQNGQLSPGSVDETISKAVSYALNQRDQEERKAKAAEAAASLSKNYSQLNQHLDQMSDKYDDFDDLVRSDHVPITGTMRDVALMLPKVGAGSAGEVLYRLGKNPDELQRISKLHPHEQAAELIALSHALHQGGESKGNNVRPSLGQVKNNPVVNSAGVTEKTTPAQIRALMKAGKFK